MTPFGHFTAGWATRASAPFALVLCLAGCGPSGSDSAPAAPEKVVHVYNWVDYVGPTTIADFEARTGIKVVYDTYDSSEIAETKLLIGNSGYDVVIVATGPTPRLLTAGALQALDRSKLPGLANLDPRIAQRVGEFDPGNAHVVPYLTGTTGFGYNVDKVEKVLGTRTLDSLAALFDPAIAAKLANCGVTWLDAPADMFQLAFIYLGLDPNSHRAEDRAAAEQLLARARPHVRYFHSSQYVNDLASGEVCVSVGWSGALQQARARAAEAADPIELAYVIPKEGAPLWIDMAGIPRDAPHPDNAHAFIAYLLEPEVIAGVSNGVGQANANSASLPWVEEAIRDDPTIYPDDDVFARLTLDRSWSKDQMREIGRAWNRIKRQP
jgi:putrescine transport system substrate-binding protein